MNDSEALGTNILGQLHEQRGQLEDAMERNQEIETNLQRSNRLIRRMFQRAFTIKIGLWCARPPRLLVSVRVDLLFCGWAVAS